MNIWHVLEEEELYRKEKPILLTYFQELHLQNVERHGQDLELIFPSMVYHVKPKH